MNLSRIYQSFKNGHSRSSGNVLNQSLDSSFRWNDDEMIDANWQPYSLNPCLPVIYGQEVLYAARGQDARSRPAKAGIHAYRDVRLHGCRW